MRTWPLSARLPSASCRASSARFCQPCGASPGARKVSLSASQWQCSALLLGTPLCASRQASVRSSPSPPWLGSATRAQGATVGTPVAMLGADARHAAADFADGVSQLLAHHAVAGLDQVQAVGENIAPLGGVEQRANGAKFGQGGQYGEYFQAIFQ